MGKRRYKGVSAIQRHHLEYQEGEFKDKVGETVLLYAGEHHLITRMQWRKHISKGFLKALRYWIDSVENDAVELVIEN